MKGSFISTPNCKTETHPAGVFIASDNINLLLTVKLKIYEKKNAVVFIMPFY